MVVPKPGRCCLASPIHPYLALSPSPLQPVGAGCQIFESRPKLAAWRQRVEAAVGSLLFQEAHEVILKASGFPPADPSVKQKLMPRVLAMLK